MYVVVELQGSKCPGVESNWVNLRVIGRDDRENGGENIVRGVSFEDDLCIWNPMSQYQCGGEGLFECFAGFSAFQSEIPNNSFSSQTCEKNHDIGVVKDESLIKICKF